MCFSLLDFMITSSTCLIQDDTGTNAKCYVMTIHDLGCSRMYQKLDLYMLKNCSASFLDSIFTEFVSQPEMRAL